MPAKINTSADQSVTFSQHALTDSHSGMLFLDGDNDLYIAVEDPSCGTPNLVQVQPTGGVYGRSSCNIEWPVRLAPSGTVVTLQNA